MNKKVKKLIVTAIIIMVVYSLYFVSCGKYTLTGEKYINSSHDLGVDYFNKTNIGNYEDIYFQLYHKNVFVFNDDTSTLIATYSADEYAKQVDKINEEIPFLEGEESGIYSDFKIGRWEFKVCEFEYTSYPNIFALIAFCDEEYKIAYLEVYAKDLDRISEGDETEGAMQKFIKGFFKYDFENKNGEY